MSAALHDQDRSPQPAGNRTQMETGLMKSQLRGDAQERRLAFSDTRADFSSALLSSGGLKAGWPPTVGISLYEA